MRKIIGIPLVIYLVFVFYIYKPEPEKEIQIAELIKKMPSDIVKLYIKDNASLAVHEMQRAKIPASITMAQAILESQYGTSLLAKQANNHFGIKADSKWGKSSRHCTHSNEWDAKEKKMIAVLSCFRKYIRVEESFAAHSDFLTGRPYYTNLFKLDIYDYESWAKGLQEAGYATDPSYAKKLIAIIKQYKLNNFDKILAESTS
jgi:flagellum-specific peptidoglycan hydrolase FlgJ